MLYKSQKDWEMSKKRYTAFWNHEMIDRACISIRTDIPASEKTPDPILSWHPQTQEELIRFWTDPEHIIRRVRAQLAQTYFAGDAFPIAPMNLGASGHAGFFRGAEYQLTEETMWFFPSHRIEELDNLEFDENSFLYRKTLELARAYAEDSNGDYMISMPDTSGNADALAALLGSDHLMTNMMEEPEIIHRAMDKMQAAYTDIMGRVFDIVRDNNEGGGCINWLSTWAPGLHAQEQCDMSVMISSPLFREFILPELQAQSRFLEYPLYHLDGYQERRHLDALLSIPELRTIQWINSPSSPPITDFIPDLQRIQAAGKSLLLHAVPEVIDELLANLSSKGLMLLSFASTPEEADAIVRRVEKLSHE